MDEFIYEISGKKYIQKPLVLGQIKQLMNMLKGIVIPHDIDTMGVIALLGDKLPEVVAVIITPEGTDLKGKNIKTLAEEIEFELSPEYAIQVIEDFFACNPIVSVLEKLSGLADQIKKKMETKKTGSSSSVSSSPAEISPSETQLFGDTPRESASLT